MLVWKCLNNVFSVITLSINYLISITFITLYTCMETMETKEFSMNSCLYGDLPLKLEWMSPSEYENKMKHDESTREIEELKKEIISQNSRASKCKSDKQF